MSDDIDIRCDLSDALGLLSEIRRRDKIITALMNQVQRNLNNPDNDFGLLQTTFVLEQEVRHRTREVERARDALAQANRDVEAARYRLTAAISAISEGFALFDLDDRLVLCNDAYREIWGFESDITGRSFTELLTEVEERHKPTDSTWFARRLQDHVSGSGTSDYRFESGKILQIRERKTPEGFTVGLYADITEMAEVEAASAARQQLLDIIEFLPDATFVVDQQKRVIAWNRAIEDMTGVHKEEIIGKGDRAYGVPFYGERLPTLLDLLDSQNPELSPQYENLHKQGNTLYGEDFVQSAFGGRGAYLGRMASPLLDREGKQVGAIESLRDITDRKQSEADLLSVQEQLRQAAKMEAIGRLAGGIAHDFNNQLTIVQGYCNLLLKSLPRENPECKLVREVLRAADRSAQLTSQLLAFGRKQVLNSEVLDLKEVLAKLQDPLARMIGEDVHIQIQVSPDLWTVKADRNQLEQAIINLAINGRDAMPSGGQLTIEARNTVLDSEYVLRHMGSSDGAHVCLSVRDNGTGMDEHTRRRIFEPFFTTKPVGVGTGLGLAMVYGFVKQSEGHIEAISEAGRGSCFNLYFPRATGTPEIEEFIPPAPPPTGSETILIIEDQEALRELTAHILKTAGYNVLQAADGYSAITLNRQYESTIDLVLCDVVMPGLSGPEAIKLIKHDRPGLKILFVTGYAERSIFPMSELGTHVLSKPFTPDTLFRMVRQVLDGDIKICA